MFAISALFLTQVWIGVEMQVDDRGIKNPLNIPERDVISQTDPRYNAYKAISDLIENSLDHHEVPCKNFYNFSCGRYEREQKLIKRMQQDYDVLLTVPLILGARSVGFFNSQNRFCSSPAPRGICPVIFFHFFKQNFLFFKQLKPESQATIFFNECLRSYKYQKMNSNAEKLEKIKQILLTTNLEWVEPEGKDQINKVITKKQLTDALGLLHTLFGIGVVEVDIGPKENVFNETDLTNE